MSSAPAREESLPVKTRTLVSVVIVALAVAVIFGVVKARPVEAKPNQQKDCAGCHGDGTYAATVTATPSAAAVAPGAGYTVALAISENPNGVFNTGYWIANSTAAGAIGTSVTYGGNTSTQQNFTVNMTAPGTPGTYYYKVFMVDGPTDNSGIVGAKVFSIVVGTPATHDVAVGFVGHYPRARHIDAGDIGGFFATYMNEGDVGETFTATLSARSPSAATTVLDTRSLTLAAGSTTTVYYPAVLTYSMAGTWTITATAGPVAGETDTLDNTWVRERTARSTTSAQPGAGGPRSVQRGPTR
jgi:hypothetical protein